MNEPNYSDSPTSQIGVLGWVCTTVSLFLIITELPSIILLSQVDTVGLMTQLSHLFKLLLASVVFVGLFQLIKRFRTWCSRIILFSIAVAFFQYGQI